MVGLKNKGEEEEEEFKCPKHLQCLEEEEFKYTFYNNLKWKT